MGLTEVFTNSLWYQWVLIFLAIPLSLIVLGAVYENFLKIYWRHKVKGEVSLLQAKMSMDMAVNKIKRDELAKETK